MSYADKLAVPYAVLLGEDEIAEGMCSVKNMRSGEQVKLTPADAAAQGCHTHQSGFRDPPAVMLGFPLVDEHKQEAEASDARGDAPVLP